MSLLVGLTGGIGSGKSLAASFFKELGAHIIDADKLCKDLVQPGRTALNEIVDHFGVGVLDRTGNLDRKKLAQIVFHNSTQKSVLEGILHPKVIEEEQNEYRKIYREDSSALVIIDAALLIESGNYKHVDKVVVVRSSKDSQIQRVVSRNQFTFEEAVSRINSQMSFDEKVKYADFILNNDSNENELRKKVVDLYYKLVGISSSD